LPPADQARLAGFRVTHVWDIAQTSGTPLPEQPRPQLLTGQAPPGLWDGLAAVIAKHGYTLERGDCGTANGLTTPATRTVRVRADIDDAQAVKTLAHELGHILLHASDPAPLGPPSPCRGTAEVEAESLAFIVATSHGMDTSAYTFPYLATWASSVEGLTPEEVIRATGQKVIAAAHETLMRLQPPAPAFTTAPPDPSVRVHAGAERTAALRLVATTPAPVTDRPAVAADRGALTAVHADALTFFRAQAHRSWVPGYLETRALSAATGTPWLAGYAPASWTALTDHLRSFGWSDPVLEASGLARRARTGALVDHFRDRLVLPVHDSTGGLVAFIGRARDGAPPQIPKYLNSPGTDLYRKGEVLYGMHPAAPALAAGAVPVLVEGPLDAIAVTAATAGRCAGIAPCGTALTAVHVAQLASSVDLAARGVVVATDGDDAGRAAAARAYDLLAPHTRRLTTTAMGPGSDPADTLRREGPGHLASALTSGARPLLEVAIEARLQPWADRLRWVEGRVGAARATAPLLVPLDGATRRQYTQRLAERLDLDPATVRGLLEPASTALSPSARPERLLAAPRRAVRSTTGPPPPSTPAHSSRAR
jgi:DNA primase catalytic core